MKRNPLTLLIALVLIAIFGLLLFTFQVRTTQVAVVTTFGNPTRQIMDPNLYFKWPWPIQKVYTFDKPIQSLEDKFTEDYTTNNFTLLTMVYVGWHITDPKEFLLKFPGGVADAKNQLESVVRSVKSSVVGRHLLSDFISTGGNSRYTSIESEMLTNVQNQVVNNNYGIAIDFLGIKKLGFPEGVTESVFTRMTSERKVLSSKLQFQGEEEAKKIESTADREAAEVLSAAQGQATQIRGEGEAEAAKYLTVFQQNPELAIFLFRLNALQQSLNHKTTLVVDQHTPPFDLFGGLSTNLTINPNSIAAPNPKPPRDLMSQSNTAPATQ